MKSNFSLNPQGFVGFSLFIYLNGLTNVLIYHSERQDILSKVECTLLEKIEQFKIRCKYQLRIILFFPFYIDWNRCDQTVTVTWKKIFSGLQAEGQKTAFSIYFLVLIPLKMHFFKLSTGASLSWSIFPNAWGGLFKSKTGEKTTSI